MHLFYVHGKYNIINGNVVAKNTLYLVLLLTAPGITVRKGKRNYADVKSEKQAFYVLFLAASTCARPNE